MEVNREREMMRKGEIVLVPCPLQGHINPMIQLGKALHSEGFSITIAHPSFNSPNPDDHPDFSFVSLDHELVPDNLIATLLKVNDDCAQALEAYLKRVGATCVISDELMYFAGDVATRLSVQSMILRTASAATFFARSTIFESQGQGVPLSHDSLSTDLVPGLEPLRFKDLPEIPDHFAVLIRAAYIKRAHSAIIWNTAKCLEQSILDKLEEQRRIPILAVGPVHKMSPPVSSSLIKEDTTCLSWLDNHPKSSVLYISCSGSLWTMSEKEACEVAWGLADSKVPFVWVVRPGSVRGSDWVEFLPEGFLEDVVGDRGLVVKWAPQKEVLGHGSVGGFWSHCGWNSTLESLSEGVPVICKPCFGDQRVNARYVTHVWRVGLEMEGFERGEIERVARALMLENEGNEMRKRGKEMQVRIEASSTKQGSCSSISAFNELVKLIMS